MKPTLDTPFSHAGPPAVQASKTVLLAYRDADHEQLGKIYWQNLARHLDRWNCARVSEWKFEMIASAALSRLATAEAHETNLILLAAHCEDSLPDKVSTWLGDWFSHRPVPGCLVVLLTETTAGAAVEWPDTSRLVAQAGKTGTELVVWPVGASAEQRSGSLLRPAWRASPTGWVSLGDWPDVAALIRLSLRPRRHS